MSVDEKSIEVAKHFLGDVKDATAMDETELAEAIQSLCESFCREIERSERNRLFIHVTPKPDACEHDFQGWRPFSDGTGGEQVCTKCGMGAMAYTLRTGP